MKHFVTFLIATLVYQVMGSSSTEKTGTVDGLTVTSIDPTTTTTTITFTKKDCHKKGKRKYRWIGGKCYHFQKNQMSVKTAQEKCATAFGLDTTITGKLFEPTSIEQFKQVNRTAAEIFGAGKEIWTGFKKVEDIEQNGENIIHSSTGEKAKIEPWLENGAINDPGQVWLRFFVRENDVWHDSEGSWIRYSICESVSEEEQ